MKVYVVNCIGTLVCSRGSFKVCSYFKVYPVIGANNSLFFHASMKGIKADIIKSDLSQNSQFSAKLAEKSTPMSSLQEIARYKGEVSTYNDNY